MTERDGVKIIDVKSLPEDFWSRRWPHLQVVDRKLEDYVSSIIDDVRRRGDRALIEFTEKFDGVRLNPEDIKVGREEIESAYLKVTERQVSAIKFLMERVERLERRRMEGLNLKVENRGVKVYFKLSPLGSVGCYIPGGEAAYPSTLIMTATPARAAGVDRIIVCTPPSMNGEINPAVLVTADLCGVKEIYRVGGAQAIAAMAYGTESIKPVEKIVGPGNIYVTTAKMLISSIVPIDAPAGPSEILIFADETADPHLIALDLISQAEHGADCIPILLTTSQKIARETAEELKRIIKGSRRKGILEESILRNCLIIRCNNTDEAVAFIDRFAPEHLEVIASNPRYIVENVNSAGLILVGPYTPVSASDYAIGTNHVLPTWGFSHVYSGLSILDFIKIIGVIECSREGLMSLKETIKTLAEIEGLSNHAYAVEGRFDGED